MGDMITMSSQELERVKLCEMLANSLIKHKKVAKQLGLTIRQTKRLLKRYREQGNKGLVSRKRGKAGNRAYPIETKEKIRELIEGKYVGFGPTFAAEKLSEEGITVSKETLRKYMIDWGLHTVDCAKQVTLHQQRARREYFGELIQIDGSHHDWFEGRGPKCCLIVFIDDATSKIVSAHFAATENVYAYFECIKKYVKTHGIPVTFYSDKHSIFRANQKGIENGETQFGRAMRELIVKTICANSPQAKGRVERANRTLQDRLVKEMQLRGISDMETANKYLDEFIGAYNKKFGKKPTKEGDMHSINPFSDQALDAILSVRHYRKLSKNLEFKFEKNTYQVITEDVRGLQYREVDVCFFADNIPRIWHNKKFVECKKFTSNTENVPIVSGKEINNIVDSIYAERTGNKLEAWKQVALLRQIESSCKEKQTLP